MGIQIGLVCVLTWALTQDAHLMSRGNELKFKVGAATNTER